MQTFGSVNIWRSEENVKFSSSIIISLLGSSILPLFIYPLLYQAVVVVVIFFKDVSMLYSYYLHHSCSFSSYLSMVEEELSLVTFQLTTFHDWKPFCFYEIGEKDIKDLFKSCSLLYIKILTVCIYTYAGPSLYLISNIYPIHFEESKAKLRPIFIFNLWSMENEN